MQHLIIMRDSRTNPFTAIRKKEWCMNHEIKTCYFFCRKEAKCWLIDRTQMSFLIHKVANRITAFAFICSREQPEVLIIEVIAIILGKAYFLSYDIFKLLRLIYFLAIQSQYIFEFKLDALKARHKQQRKRQVLQLI